MIIGGAPVRHSASHPPAVGIDDERSTRGRGGPENARWGRLGWNQFLEPGTRALSGTLYYAAATPPRVVIYR